MYLTIKQREVINQAEKIIQEATKKTKEELQLGNCLISLYLENCLNKKDSESEYAIKLYDKVNNAIKDFIYYCADNGYRDAFLISDFKKVEGLPGEVINKMVVLFSYIAELKIYQNTGARINEL